MQPEFLLSPMARPIKSHSWDWDWSWRGSGISQNSVGTPDMIRTRSKSEAEISSLKDDALSPAAESSLFSSQMLDRRIHTAFSCCTSTSAYGEETWFE